MVVAASDEYGHFYMVVFYFVKNTISYVGYFNQKEVEISLHFFSKDLKKAIIFER